MKKYVAYAIPLEDHHLIVEDGLGLIALGDSQEEAEAKVKEMFVKEQEEMVELSKKHGYTEGSDERMEFFDCYAIHSHEI
jgi:hypothetical protein